MSFDERLGLMVDREVTEREDARMDDAILDCLVHNAYRIELKGESMRRHATKLMAAGASD